MQGYKKYDVEDFVADKQFADWVINPTNAKNNFWINFTKKYPNKKNSIAEAKEIIKSLKSVEITIPKDKKKEIWAKVVGKRKKYWLTTNLYKYAAVFLLLLTVGIAAWLHNNKKLKIETTNTVNALLDGEKAVLILTDGKKIDLLSEENKLEYGESGEIIKLDNNKEVSQKVENKMKFNTVVVPYGHRTKIYLPDRTIVWINAGSTLTYPVSFSQNQRTVQLSGEAYFEVSHNENKAFIVKTTHSEINVLGTKFNVTAYPEDQLEETVLIEGKVQMSTKTGLLNDKVILKPNQKASLLHSKRNFTIREVNVQDYIAWVNQMFTFNDITLNVVFKRLSRYYDVKIQATDEVNNISLKGKLDLNEDLSKVLDRLNLLVSIKYEITGDTVTIKK